MTVSVPVLCPSRILLVRKAEWLEMFAERLSSSSEASVETVETKSEALDVVRDATVNCLITEYVLDETTGVELREEIRDETKMLSLVLGAASGSEDIASEVIDAGITDYVAVGKLIGGTIEELLRRTEQAVQSARQTATQ